MQYAKNLRRKSQVVDDAVRKIDECRKQKDYYFADYGKMVLNGFGIVVMHGPEGSTWASDPVAAKRQMETCSDNMMEVKARMIRSGEWPSGT